MKPIEELIKEHQAVELALQILNRIIAEIGQTREISDPHPLVQLFEFFSVFVDKCHHGKEEKLLFPALESMGVSRDGGPIGVMLDEHQQGRANVSNMKKAFAQYLNGDHDALRDLKEQADAYIALLTQHIEKENQVLFPMATGNLSPNKEAELEIGFNQIETEIIGAGKHEAFHRMLDDLESKYLNQRNAKKEGFKMQARAPLMIEHRLIERMIKIIKQNIIKIEEEGQVDPVSIDTAVDFIQIYADRTHHGKEEDILFKKLSQRNLSDNDRQAMAELVEEHVYGRAITQNLIAANDRYRKGDLSALSEIVSNLRLLVAFYPKHIEKEDKVFFPSARSYFSDQEDQEILDAFWKFDRKMIHEKYSLLVGSFEGGRF